MNSQQRRQNGLERQCPAIRWSREREGREKCGRDHLNSCVKSLDLISERVVRSGEWGGGGGNRAYRAKGAERGDVLDVPRVDDGVVGGTDSQAILRNSGRSKRIVPTTPLRATRVKKER
jgi:hypothetical protein